MSRDSVACVTSMPRALQPLAQLLLAVDRLPIDQLEHERLPIRLHNYSNSNDDYTHYAYGLNLCNYLLTAATCHV